MKLLKLFEEEEEDIVKEDVYCMECNREVSDCSVYYSNEGEGIYCSYECYIKKLNREYFE